MAGDAVKFYDANQVTTVFGAARIDSGFNDGQFLRITKTEKDFGVKVGADGQVTRFKTNNNVYEIKVTLMQTSNGHAKFTAIRALDLAAPNGAGVAPIAVADLGGANAFAASACWISGPPEQVYGREAEGWEWTLQCADGVEVCGGN